MKYTVLTIFPEIFAGFLHTSLIDKAQGAGLIGVNLINIRDFSTDPHQQIDDMPYGGGAGMVLKAQPCIDSIRSVVQDSSPDERVAVRLLGPTKEVFVQQHAHDMVDTYDHCIILCGRYEGFDYRVKCWCEETFGDDFAVCSLGKYVTLGGEVPAMMFIEATARLLPGVIKEDVSWQHESYRPELGGENIEYPQYTRPAIVEGMGVPDILFSGHHAHIAQWRKDMME